MKTLNYEGYLIQHHPEEPNFDVKECYKTSCAGWVIEKDTLKAIKEEIKAFKNNDFYSI